MKGYEKEDLWDGNKFEIGFVQREKNKPYLRLWLELFHQKVIRLKGVCWAIETRIKRQTDFFPFKIIRFLFAHGNQNIFLTKYISFKNYNLFSTSQKLAIFFLNY